MGLRHPTLKSFFYAFSGVKEVFIKEPNMRVHTLAAIAVLALACFLNFGIFEWIILLFAISFVLVLELINTVLESIVNLVSPEVREEARIAKDISAAAVLLSTIVAVIIGALLFLPKII